MPCDWEGGFVNEKGRFAWMRLRQGAQETFIISLLSYLRHFLCYLRHFLYYLRHFLYYLTKNPTF